MAAQDEDIYEVREDGRRELGDTVFFRFQILIILIVDTFCVRIRGTWFSINTIFSMFRGTILDRNSTPI